MLPELSDDIWRKVALAVKYDPLQRCTAVYTSKVMWEAMPRERLAELKQQRQQASELLRAVRKSSCELGAKYGIRLTLSQWRMLGTLARRGSLERLKRLVINDERPPFSQLAEGLRRGSLRSLQELWLVNAGLGPQGATALANVLTNRAVPALDFISLAHNQIGDAGLAALAPALRQLCKLKALNLHANQIGNQGLAALLAPPTAGVLKSLEHLYLNDNPRITDAGCAVLVSALHGGALPALKQLYVLREEAMEAVRAARPGLQTSDD